MTAAEDVWVGGDRRILHWDGSAWTAPAGTCTGTPQVAAMAIHAYARAECWWPAPARSTLATPPS